MEKNKINEFLKEEKAIIDKYSDSWSVFEVVIITILILLFGISIVFLKARGYF